MDPMLTLNDQAYFGSRPVAKHLHILVELPQPPPPPLPLAPLSLPATIPTLTPLANHEAYAAESVTLDKWNFDAVHTIPSISSFMAERGGCSTNGKIFWRTEETMMVKLLLRNWYLDSHVGVRTEGGNSGFSAGLFESTTIPNPKRAIVVGSPGIGKSTLLCLVAFHLHFKHKKNVMVYRRIGVKGAESCLFYVGYENGKTVYFSTKDCPISQAIYIYGAFNRSLANVWLLVDSFKLEELPMELCAFKMFATSQQANLAEQERVNAYKCLFPCWRKKELFMLGKEILGWETAEMEQRYYYSGGNVRQFSKATVESIIRDMDDYISMAEDEALVLSNSANVHTGKGQIDRLRRTFFTGKIACDNELLDVALREQFIDSEYVLTAVSMRIRSDPFYVYITGLEAKDITHWLDWCSRSTSTASLATRTCSSSLPSTIPQQSANQIKYGIFQCAACVSNRAVPCVLERQQTTYAI